MMKGRSFYEFPAVIMRRPPIHLGLTFLVTRQCGEILLQTDKCRLYVLLSGLRLSLGTTQANVKPVKHIIED